MVHEQLTFPYRPISASFATGCYVRAGVSNDVNKPRAGVTKIDCHKKSIKLCRLRAFCPDISQQYSLQKTRKRYLLKLTYIKTLIYMKYQRPPTG